MSRVIVRTGTAESFFRRASAAARRADEDEAFDGAITLSFEDPQRMFAVLSAARRELVRAVIGKPMTLADLTRALKRERTGEYAARSDDAPSHAAAYNQPPAPPSSAEPESRASGT